MNETIYGYRRGDGTEEWCTSRDEAEFIATANNYTLVAYDRTPSRVVSIRP